MPSPKQQLIGQIHASPTRIVVALSGGGSRAIAELLEVPGASRTILEVVMPYSKAAITRWLGGPPDQFCSPETARAMAMAAFRQACEYDRSDAPQAGIASTSSLATDRPKRGPHRVHAAIQTARLTAAWSLELEKGQRSRAEEEQLASRLVLNMAAEACGLAGRLDLDLLEGERLEETSTLAPRSWQDLLLGKVDAVRQGGPAGRPASGVRAVFSGAFNPMHVGHRRMVQIAEDLLGVDVELEISIVNVDKPPLDFLEIERRTSQLDPERAVWLTRLATFEEKSQQFPGATFVVGTDTLRRIADPHYYGDDRAAYCSALEHIAARGCRFLVFGRAVVGSFVTLANLELPRPLQSICREVPAERFREDICSTELRRRLRKQ